MNNDDKAAAMQDAFQQFMLGTSKKDSNEEVRQQQQQKQQQKEEEEVTKKTRIKKKEAERRNRRIFQSFSNTVKNNWLDVDCHLLEVLETIRDVQSRIGMELSCLRERRDDNIHDWSACGYRQRQPQCRMHDEDVHRALSHDLIQYEKMMTGIRSLLCKLSECQDRLGKYLDEAILVVSSRKDNDFVESMQTVYGMLGMELYRKQCLAQIVLSESEDLSFGSLNEECMEDVPSKKTLRNSSTIVRCCHEWPTTSRQSRVNMKELYRILSTHTMMNDEI